MNRAITMSHDEPKAGQEQGWEQCIVEAQNDGEICWHLSDSREREPIHTVKKNDRFWCWSFKVTETGYTHDYANHAPTNVPISTNVELKLVYVTDSCDDEELYKCELDKSPNWT